MNVRRDRLERSCKSGAKVHQMVIALLELLLRNGWLDQERACLNKADPELLHLPIFQCHVQRGNRVKESPVFELVCCQTTDLRFKLVWDATYIVWDLLQCQYSQTVGLIRHVQ